MSAVTEKADGYFPGRRLIDAANIGYVEDGSPEAVIAAQNLAHQSASLCLVCALALDAAMEGPKSLTMLDQAAEAVSALMGKCWDDLNVAASMMA